MSTTTTNSTNPTVKLIGLLTIIAGAIMIIAGGVTWGAVTSQLKAEEIVVSAVTEDEPGSLAGKPVAGPFTAFAQANAINHHALAASEGRTYAQIGDDAKALKAELAADGASESEIAEDEGVVALASARTTVMNGSFLRTALFSSVIAYGVAALVIGLGVLFAILGFALRSTSTTTVVSTPVVPQA
ncbi:aromatic ring-opening dioxygenase LigA [Pengzhenrongella frigida]|uniref:Aromatic ring-opening dioxygenase LigA n=1 Tax=Pengzhenrongella frigida TaxID=1259133 RepID=A0A4Q5N2B5_9MICO|nr:aromatic ring-opening dioxygenase LigA [Cellulomonas sp. HLT2-17]RYV52196.1 aromatic ring-opening dioxygenase LigA [Cellulomonas sp. HLT2-17]